MKQILLTGALSILSFSRAMAQGTGGQNPPPKSIKLTDPLEGQDFVQVIGKVTGALELLAIPVVAVMVLYGAFQIMTAGGNPTKVSDGRKTILYAVIGYAVILLASSVVPLINDVLGN